MSTAPGTPYSCQGTPWLGGSFPCSPSSGPWSIPDAFSLDGPLPEEADKISSDDEDDNEVPFVVTRAPPPSMAALEQSLKEAKGLYKDKFEEQLSEDAFELLVVR